MNVLTGTSGFSFDEWQGRFYPKGLASEERLAHYASRLRSVEINNTFYQMPKAALLERWRDTVPDHFRFAIKAPRRFTHGQRLQIPSESLGYFLTALSALGNKLGPVLFQLPPFLRKDAPLLADFLERLPAGLKWAFEFRHASWFSEEILALLASKNAALCLGDSDERGISATCGCGRQVMTKTRYAPGPSAFSPSAGRTLSFISSTRCLGPITPCSWQPPQRVLPSLRCCSSKVRRRTQA